MDIKYLCMEGFNGCQRKGLSAMLIFVMGQPEPLLSKVNDVDVIFCCPALLVKSGLQLICERDD